MLTALSHIGPHPHIHNGDVAGAVIAALAIAALALLALRSRSRR